MNDTIANILAECLDALDRGDVTIEECKRRYPQNQEELKYLLLLSKYIKEAPEVTPSPAFRNAAKVRMENLIRNHTTSRNIQHSRPAKKQLLRKSGKRVTVKGTNIARMITTAIIIIALLFGGTVGTAAASNDALPGDTLYPVKTSFEDIQLVFANDEGDVELTTKFANNRVEEIEALVEADRYNDIPIAVQAYENNIADLAHAMANLSANDPARAEAHASLLEAARANRSQVLTGLLDKVPEQAKKGIQRAIEAGPPDHAGGPPEGKVNVKGEVTQVNSDGSLTVQLKDGTGVTVHPAASETFDPSLEGTTVHVKGTYNTDGSIQADWVKAVGPDDDGEGQGKGKPTQVSDP